MLKQRIAHALDSSDVPMGESATLTEGDPDLLGRRRRLRGRHLAPVGVGLVVVIFGVGALAEDVDAPTTRVLSASATTTTKPSGPTTTTGAVLVPTDDPNASTTSTTVGGGGVAVVPADPGPQLAPPVVPPPAPPAPTAFIRAPTSVPRADAWVTVTWGSTNATSVTVAGPQLSSGELGGSRRVCPGTLDRSGACQLGAAATYTITARGAAGQTVSSSVTVSPG
jgi:hypothetical protein